MGKIVILDENTSNQIAAGEVIERPASIVKEMAENALDAGATSITVEIAGGGIKSIRITDNGDGIEEDDVAMAFERHATSKIKRIEDLNRLSTMGFRGEALASIASVSRVEVITKTEEAKTGTRVVVEAGNIISVEPTGAPRGTTFIVRELFYNTPARYKFLKKDSTESGYIYDILVRIALARPDVSIKLINQGKTVMHTPGNHDLLSVIYSIYGKETARSIIPVNASDDGIEITGYVGKPEISRGNRSSQSFYVNDRFVYNRIMTMALEEAYKTRLMQKRFPFAVLKLKITPRFVDVNVHPAKLEVRFSDEQKIFRTVYHAVLSALSGASLIPGERDDYKKPAALTDDQGSEKQMRLHEIPPMESKESSKDINTNKSGYDINNITAGETRDGSQYNAAMNKINNLIDAGNGMIKNDNDTGGATGTNHAGDGSNAGNINDIAGVNINNAGGINRTEKTGDITPGTGLYSIERETPNTSPDKDAKISFTGSHMAKTGEDEYIKPALSQDFADPVADDRRKLLNARIIGQAFNSFIILEDGEELLLIDQHAAHERIQYEKTIKQFQEGNSFSQMLLNPLTVNLSELEMDKFHELSPVLKKLGFEAEDFGERTVIIRSIPYVLNNGISGQDFLDILNKLQKEADSVSEIIPEETIYMMACKSAVKANRNMSEMEIRGLVEDLTRTGNPYTCVHGRPIIISMNRKEMEKKFKRIL